MRRSVLFYCGLMLMQCLGSGCAHYEFDMTRPADLATHIGDKDVVITRSPLDYDSTQLKAGW